MNEVFHKLMVAEVIKKFRVTAKQATKLIKERPETIEELEIVWIEMELISYQSLHCICRYPEYSYLHRCSFSLKQI